MGKLAKVLYEENSGSAAVVRTTEVAVVTPAPEVAASHGPFTQVVRDPAKYQASLAIAERIGKIKGSQQVYNLIHEVMEQENREVVYILCLNMHLQVVEWEELARGSKSHVGFELEDVWQLLALTRPHGYILAHCHPSGDARPSKADIELTHELRRKSKQLFPHTALCDHIIVGQKSYYSFADQKWR